MTLGLERARLLLRKASIDEFVFETLKLIPEAPIEALGFHAQQAVEKYLKAVLSSAEIDYGRHP